MFGITDPQIIIAIAGTLLSALLCVVYGIIKWNKD